MQHEIKVPERGQITLRHHDKRGHYTFGRGHYGQVIMAYNTAHDDGECHFTETEAKDRIKRLQADGWHQART